MAGALLLGLGGEASAQHLRFHATQPGGVVAVGNTLGLAKGLNQNGPGTEDSIGTFISLGATTDDVPANPANPWPVGTTYDWTQNGSTAVLALSDKASVLYAELIWGGSSNYATENVTTHIDDMVTLSVAGDSIQVQPSPDTALTIAELSASGLFYANYYLRSGDVTQFVQQHMSGTYSASAVPATQDMTVNDLNAAGWTLVVAYRDERSPIRNLAVFVGGSWVDEDSVEDYAVAGFCAPPYGAVEGKVIVSALEGDADRVGDQLALAPTSLDPFVTLSGPNNPENNFFCSQINGEDGLVDTQGSFGDANHDAINGVNVVGGRQGWDITKVSVSSAQGQLANGQTSAVVRTQTVGDSYVPALVGFEIDVKSPDFTQGGSTTEASMDPVQLGDAFTVTARLENQGEAPAMNVVLELPLDSNLGLTDFTLNGQSGDVNGNPVTAADLSTGVAVGDVAIGDTTVAVLGLQVNGSPQTGSTFMFVPTWQHGFQMCDNGPMLDDQYTSDTAIVDFLGDGGTGGAGGAGATGGTGGVGNTGPGNNGSGAVDLTTDSGCGCALPGSGDLGASAGRLAWLGLGAACWLRRRRRA